MLTNETMILLGIGIALIGGIIRAKREGFPSIKDCLICSLIMLISGFMGAHLLQVILHWPAYEGRWDKILIFWKGGLALYGGFAGCLMGAWVYLKLRNIPILKTMDMGIPFIALSMVFWRIGCFLNGCCKGVEGHPTQLYEAGYQSILFFVFLKLSRQRWKPGTLVVLYFLSYAIGRFAIEFWRVGEQWGPLSYNQWISLLIILGGIFFMKLNKQIINIFSFEFIDKLL